MKIISGTKINVLGTEYEILVRSEKDYPRLYENFAHVDRKLKKIVIKDEKDFEDCNVTTDNIRSCQEQILKKNIIYAFLYESGFDYNKYFGIRPETMEFLLLYFGKINDCFNTAMQ